MIVTSGQSLEHLLRITPEESRKPLLKKRMVVPSARMLEKARALGFTQVPRIAEPVSDAGFCAACAAFVPESSARKL